MLLEFRVTMDPDGGLVQGSQLYSFLVLLIGLNGINLP